jgi:hypothetical protein
MVFLSPLISTCVREMTFTVALQAMHREPSIQSKLPHEGHR